MSTATTLTIQVRDAALSADLALPDDARGIVIFAHGSGSSRRSPRNLYVANRLQTRGFGTLLFDLLTPQEQAHDAHGGHLRFRVALLAERLAAATAALADHEGAPPWRGYFGASTGAAAALVAAAAAPAAVNAIVSRGGRPDLAGAALERVRAPTLLIVGGADELVLGLNENALRALQCEKALAIVPDATHLFDEPGALDDVCDHASAWFLKYCGAAGDG